MHIARWTSDESSPFDRGVAFGEALAPAIENTVAVYGRMFREDVGLEGSDVISFGAEVAAMLEDYRPALVAEIRGIAAGAGQSTETLMAVNARTELLTGGTVAGATGGECSTIGVVLDGGASAALLQTWDFHPDLADSRVVWTQRRPSGWFTVFTEAGIVGKMGINSAGLAVGLNFLATDQDTRVGGIPVHLLARVLVEEAQTIEDASELVDAVRISASVCLTVAGPRRDEGVDVVALELWPGGVERLTARGSSQFLAHTNHFLRPIAADDVLASGSQAQGTKSRYDQLVAGLEREPRRDLDALVQHLSSLEAPPGGQPIFRLADDELDWLQRCATLATIGFEIPSGRFWLRDSFDSRAPLELVENPK